MVRMKTFLVLGAFCLIQFVNSQSDCPQGWTRWREEKCFLPQREFVSYQTAQQVCATKGGLLATIKEEAEQTFFDNLIHNVSGIEEEVWLGATRISETEFQWEDGAPLYYTHWAPASPSEIYGRDCVVMQSRISKLAEPQGKWRDVSCTRPNYFVCESEPVWSSEEMRRVLVETRRKLDNLAQQHEALVYRHEYLVENHNSLAHQHETLVDSHEDLVGKHDNLVQNPVPIGFIYTQLPGQPVPSSLWPNIRWREVSYQFAGKFFRVAGDAAASFGTTQWADSPRLTNAKSAGFGSLESRNVTIVSGSWSPWLFTGPYNGAISYDHVSFYVSNPEIRPINTAVRIWVRES